MNYNQVTYIWVNVACIYVTCIIYMHLPEVYLRYVFLYGLLLRDVFMKKKKRDIDLCFDKIGGGYKISQILCCH